MAMGGVVSGLVGSGDVNDVRLLLVLIVGGGGRRYGEEEKEDGFDDDGDGDGWSGGHGRGWELGIVESEVENGDIFCVGISIYRDTYR